MRKKKVSMKIIEERERSRKRERTYINKQTQGKRDTEVEEIAQRKKKGQIR